MTHREFIGFFLKIKSQKIAELTLNSYKQCLKKYLPENELLEDLDIFKAQEIMFKMENLSKATQRRNLTILTQYYEYAKKYQICAKNPFKDVERPILTKTNVLQYAINEKELSKLLFAINKLPILWQTFFILSLDSGARRGEVLAICWNDIDFMQKTIIIKHSAYCSGETKIKEPKGKKERIIHLSEYTINKLQKVKNIQKKEALKKGAQWLNSNYVFSKNGQKPFNPSTVTHTWQKFIKSNKLSHHRLHDLRHTCATMLLNKNIDVNTVRLRLGHSQLSTTMLYIHSQQDIMAATIISNIFTDYHWAGSC